ncbi:MAG TPA: ATP-binding protein [Rudaea sp.]|jgi:anti-sigma regulatory factor (Ser/Thr protein kinase)
MGKHERRARGAQRASARAPTAAWQFVIERERAAIGRFNAAMQQTLRTHVPESALRALQVSLDELLTNVIMHAEQAAGPIEVEIERVADSLDTTIGYIAREFDPTAWKPAARSASVATTRIGGLGIVLVRSLMDDFRYSYDDGRNVVRLRKRC